MNEHGATAPIEDEARRSLMIAQAAARLGRHEAALAAANDVLRRADDLPTGVRLDGQRRHRWASMAIATAADALIATGRADAAAALVDPAWAADPVDPFVAAAWVRTREAVDGEDGAIAALGLSRVSAPVGDERPDAAVCLSVCRDEAAQVDSFLAHHRGLGVRRFLVVDNGSSDGTREELAGQPDVELWATTTSFRDLAFGATAFTALARRHLLGRWCLLVDLDERFLVPRPATGLHALTACLDERGHDALPGLLVDLYDDRPLVATRRAVPEQLAGSTFLDRTWSHRRHHAAGPFGNATHVVGGARERVFGVPPEVLLNKVPLVRFTGDRLLVGGQHDTNAPAARTSPGRAAVLHTKFLADGSRFAAEARRGQRANGAADDARYAAALDADPRLTMWSATESVRYTGPAQLAAAGITRPLDAPPNG